MWALLSFSPNTSSDQMPKEEQDKLIQEREALLRKHNMINEYKAMRVVLENLYKESISLNIPVGRREDYFPRFFKPGGYVSFMQSINPEVNVRTIRGKIELENKNRYNNYQTMYRIVVVGKDGFAYSTTSKSLAENRLVQLQARQDGNTYEIKVDDDVLVPYGRKPKIMPNSVEEEQFIEEQIQRELKAKGKPGMTSSVKQRQIQLLTEKVYNITMNQ